MMENDHRDKYRDIWKKKFPDFLKEIEEQKPQLKVEVPAVKKLLEKHWRLEVFRAIQEGKPVPLEVFDSFTEREKSVLFYLAHKEVEK